VSRPANEGSDVDGTQVPAVDSPDDDAGTGAGTAAGAETREPSRNDRTGSDTTADADGRLAAVGADRRPALASAILAFVLTGSGTALLAASRLSVAAGVCATLAVGFGAVLGRRAWISGGTILFLAGVSLAGFWDVPPLVIATATLLALVGWDVGRYGITVGEQLGRTAGTLPIELAHATASLLVGGAGLVLASATFFVVGGGQTNPGLAAVLVGVVLLLSAVR